MYIKYKLAKRDGWNYELDVETFQVQYFSLAEHELSRWFKPCITECESVNIVGEDSDGGIECSYNKEFKEGFPMFCYLDIVREDGHRLILIDTEAYLCRDNGETAQRLL